MLADNRRKHSSADRRRNGGIFKNSEEKLQERVQAREKLEEYRESEGADNKFLATMAGFLLLLAYASVGAGMFQSDSMVWTGVIGAILSLLIGTPATRAARKRALARFKAEQVHLARYV